MKESGNKMEADGERNNENMTGGQKNKNKKGDFPRQYPLLSHRCVCCQGKQTNWPFLTHPDPSLVHCWWTYRRQKSLAVSPEHLRWLMLTV